MTQRLRTCLTLWSIPLGAALYQVSWLPLLLLSLAPLLFLRRLTLYASLIFAGWLYARSTVVSTVASHGPWEGTLVKEAAGTSLTIRTSEGNLRASCQPLWPTPYPGDVVSVLGTARPTPEKLLATTARDRVHAYIPSARCTTKPRRALSSLPLRIRQKLERPILHSLPEPEGSFVAGLVLGSRQLLSSNLRDALQTTGTSHLVAVSGANVTLLLGMLRLLVPAPPRLRVFVSLIGSIFVVLVTGASSAVVRGACMAWLGALLWFRNRQVYPSVLLAAAAFLTTLYNPLIPAHDGSFQFSYAAFGSLLVLGPLLQKHVVPKLLWAPELLRNHFLETLAATTGTIPLSYVRLGSVSLLGLIVNPLILWLVPCITLAGAALVAVGPIPYVGTLLGLILLLPARVMLRTITAFA